MKHSVKIYIGDRIITKKAEDGTNILEFIQKNSVHMTTPCGGNGTCGKCRIKVKGVIGEASEKEKRLLGGKAFEQGYRLACFNGINSDMEVHIPVVEEQANIVTEGRQRDIRLNAVVSKQCVELERPDIDNQRSDIETIESYIRRTSVNPINEIEMFRLTHSIDFMRDIPDIIRADDFRVTLVRARNTLIGIEAGDTTQKLYGIAVDIGTTTIAAYLYNLLTGERMDVYSRLNPQRKFGADVLSRIKHTMDSKKGSDDINKLIISCINEIIEYFAIKQKIVRTDIYAVVFVGNTTMMHFLMGISARNIAVLPFTAVTTKLHEFGAGELGIDINACGQAVIFPSVSGYIGADTIAAVLSSGMHLEEKTSLLIDIGTNGEVVLGNNKGMYSCSTAAGPAFEGANIRNGVGGIKGAIDKVNIDTEVTYTTIGNSKAIGICGSGIIDAVAAMLKTGIIDETGLIIERDEMGSECIRFSDRIIDIYGARAFLLVSADKSRSSTDVDIVITQKDIREIQNAKAAIAAGIKTLSKQAGIALEDIEKIYLAGGFGSYINIGNALKIGLIPSELEGRIESIGNAAGTGAAAGLLSRDMLTEAEDIKSKIKYVELSASADFVNEYVDSMLFEN